MAEALLVLSLLCVVALIRNHLVFKIRQHAIDVIHHENVNRIRSAHRGDGPATIKLIDYADFLGDPYSRFNYSAMLLDLTRWSFKSFYPSLYKLERKK